jgi:hypothetical protein
MCTLKLEHTGPFIGSMEDIRLILQTGVSEVKEFRNYRQ